MEIKMLFTVFFIVLINKCVGIPELNDTEYSRMPPVFKMDHFDDCIFKPNGTYCMANFVLVSDTQNDLLDMITEYSKAVKTRFNHTKLRHGICVSQKCRYVDFSNKEDRGLNLEACLNKTYWDEYKLKTKIIEPLTCNTNEKEDVEYDVLEIIAAVVFILILLTNVIGTIGDYYWNGNGNSYLLCFSVRRNCHKLFISYANFDEDQERLKSIHGIRMLTIVGVVGLHSVLITITTPANTRFIENLYDNIINYVYINGTIVVQSFFVMAGFLLAYNTETVNSRENVSWKLIPLGCLRTFIRLTPSYAVILLFTMTWLKRFGFGPLWLGNITLEAESCKVNWLSHLLYFNNYLGSSYCMLQTWYLAANVQLMIMGYFICALARSTIVKCWTLGILFVIGIMLPAAYTFYYNLDAVLLMSPEFAFTFNDNPTFKHVYKTGHTNIPNFIMGIALGCYTYYCQKQQVDMAKFKKYKFLFNLQIPIILTMMLFGSIFKDGLDIPPYIRAIYAGLIKPIYGCCLCTMIFGSVFKFENFIRPILEWRMWKVPARLSYSAYIIHVTIIRLMTGLGTSVYDVNYLHLLQIALGVLVIVYLITIPFWLCIEGPIIALYNLSMRKKTVRVSESSK
ncbi:nose resistant to fluoxetine protein 6 [Pieris rapae]|uniref:nose resistant to fluoxetine protein 6 n=1 Tax=Pieris rapae TaxID=64459 RepID=UPI001E279E21|nr:nose resistant to fluoxetine protein 6 [Pieris rapae]